MGAARSRFVPLLSWKNPCRPASTQVGCVGRSSAVGKAAASLGAATFAPLQLVASSHLLALEGGRCDSEGSDFLALVFIAEEQVSQRPRLSCTPVEAGRAAWGEHPLAAWLDRRRKRAAVTELLCRPQGWLQVALLQAAGKSVDEDQI